MSFPVPGVVPILDRVGGCYWVESGMEAVAGMWDNGRHATYACGKCRFKSMLNYEVSR